MSQIEAADSAGDKFARAGRTGRSALLGVSLAYCVILLYLVWPFLLRGQSLYVADFTYNFAPAANFIAQVFQAEHGFTLTKPLWNPYLLCGAPQVAVAWPLAYLPGYIACFLDGAQGQAFLIFFHLLIAGIGGYVWFSKCDDRAWSAGGKTLAGKSAGNIGGVNNAGGNIAGGDNAGGNIASRLADITSPAALFGFMFMLSGYMLGSSINLSLLFSVCWTPFALTLIDRLSLASRVSLPLTGALSFILAQQFGAGRPEMFLGEGILYAAYALLKIAELAPDRSKRQAAERFMLELVAALMLSLAYNAANILPMIEAVKNSPHLPKFDPSDALNWSAGWFEYLEILLMQPLGELNMAHYSLYPTYPNSMAYVTSLFLGAPVLALAFIGTSDSSWKQKAFWLWMIILFTIVSLGEFIPIWKPIYEAIPSINLLRFPVKMTVFVELGIVALAARGWHLALKGDVPRKEFLGAGVFWGLFFCIGMAILATTVSGNMQSLGVVMSMSSGCDDLNMAKEAALNLAANITMAGFAGLATCLALANLKGKWEIILRCFVVLLIVTDLMMNGTRQLWHTVDIGFFKEPSTILSLVEKEVAKKPEAHWNTFAPRDYKVLSLFRHPIAVPEMVSETPEGLMDKEFMRYARNILAPNTNIDRGIFMLSGMPVLPDWATVFMETGILPRSSVRAELTHEAGKSDIPLYKWCQATATKYILCPINTQSEEDLVVRESKLLDTHYFKVAAEDKKQNVRIYEVSPIRKRVQLFAHALKVETRTEALKHINRSDTLPYDPLSECILCEPEQPSTFSFQSKGPEINQALLEKVLHAPAVNRPGSAEIVSDDRESVLVNVDCAVPAVLVFTDSYYSGWNATDNGAPAHLLLSDGLMKAVLLAPGKHKVAFRYIPNSYFVGLTISFGTLIILLGLISVPCMLETVKSTNLVRRREIIQS
ncbi:MAG: hypothetical protein IT342_14405 [Candidatus Melainabacteria bacterium]|nr:hypothetical protein [Candidatus Melainabacteria bacterium]